MKGVGAFLLLALLATLVVGLGGCVALDQAIVKVEPSTIPVGVTYTVSYIFRSFEPTTVTVSKIDVYETFDGYNTTRSVGPGDLGWKTDTVPPFQEVVIWSRSFSPFLEPGSGEIQATFYTSEGVFYARAEWTVVP